MSELRRIAVIGAGAWGTALALVAMRAGREAILWARERDVVEAISARRENAVFLPGIRLDPPFAVTGAIGMALAGANAAILAVPAQFLRAQLHAVARTLPPHAPLILAAKGIEEKTGALLSEAIVEALPHHPLAILSGPTFAAEVARGLPTAATVACRDRAVADAVALALSGRGFRPYASDDPIGVEIGGAVKNVIAIACGVVVGRGLGENARAALLTRGLAEITRLGIAKGAKPETFMGLSGLGDLALTCGSPQSRNMSLGIALGQGRKLGDILAERRSVAEGVATSAAVVALARRLEVDMPISAAVDAVLHHGADIDATIDALLSRPLKAE
ncbi:MAG: NAD(P)-dependent glycerol-3-phosphate dehydrogenase [Rhodospirillaceae bacterium]|nr:NAD(P)-dependent glycerol-3-phosphate dehydrogenase [Rhodospirillaceae bacterium]